MKTIQIRNLTLGEGRTKICVPVCEKTAEAVISSMKEILELPAQIIEFRADWFDDVFDPAKLSELLKQIREAAGEMPILFTFRTAKEGGEKEITDLMYDVVVSTAIASGCMDAVDVEMFMDETVVANLLDLAHKSHVPVIMSNHDFEKTPDKDEIIARLIRMDEMGADVLKIALMPNTYADVLKVLAATEEMKRLYTDKPMITMSMGGMGLMSRLSGESFGSALSFGAGAKASAPGQMAAKDLDAVLNAIHTSLTGQRS